MPAVNSAAHYPVSTRRAPIAAAAFVLVLLATACGRDAVRPAPQTGDVVPQRPAAVARRDWPQVTPADPVAANSVLMRAISLVGTPYRYGGNTPEGGFDCSGLVNYIYRDMLDLKLPRTSRDLAAYQGPRIAPERLATADLVFFGSNGNVSHVGIYVGEGRFVHAPSTGGTVRLDHLDGSYWRSHYSGSRRVLQ
ncbi:MULTISPECIES: C40 family peptidase [unclassified Luteimonas]|uniref:C40 family peptidase n=1 Tax=unclassified Luteimonas TaxID=2629088 RepID=UPI00160054A6|nr:MULTISPECIES: C40 family peptidase [unclassified Luteimonas]MBB1472527.1 C40 family peptidase [Luteimonas sp. MC1782]MBB6598753.1 C40 family peptidase [Luteimonas sp. MC1825]QOC89469.1 C40 family peptidase [Luteimonas sp. MC1825]